MKPLSDIGMIGLAVMGENLTLNFAGKGFQVACFNRETEWVDAFIAGRAAGKSIVGTHSIEELCSKLQRPRKVMMMIKAGNPVDEVIGKLVPFLEPGDIIIDGGNSMYLDSARRCVEAEARGLLYVGSGVSGGEEGALNGPSMMPGGSPAAWPYIKEMFQAIAARTPQGEPCCNWVGPGGAGHFAKIVHNGIEYGDMQMICEVYDLMRRLLRLSNDQMAETFARWDEGELDSYLVEITRDILAYRDENGDAVIDKILDTAGQKGTGRWMVGAAMEMGAPLTLISEAVFARSLSALKEERLAASKILTPDSAPELRCDRKVFTDDLGRALYASKIVSYAQGFDVLRAASKYYDWNLDLGGMALLWRGGCIIRSAFLERIKEAYQRNPNLANLVLDPFFAEAVTGSEGSWRRVVSTGIEHAMPLPAMSSALAWYDGYRTAELPANLLQAQRDYFGAHNYERTDRPRGEFYHTNWTGREGGKASTAYNV